MKQRIQSFRASVARNSGKVLTGTALLASSGLAHAEGDYQTAVTTALTTGATAVGAVLAVAITIPIALKGYQIIKRAFAKG